MFFDDIESLKFSRTLASKKIGRGTTSQSTDRLLPFIDSFCRSLGVPAKVARPLARPLKEYLSGELSHTDASTELFDSVPRLVAVAKVRPLFALSNLVGAFGFFQVSQGIESLTLAKLRRAPRIGPFERSSWVTRQLQASLLAGDLEAVRRQGVRFENRNRQKIEASESYRVLSDYARTIVRRGLGNPNNPPNAPRIGDDWMSAMRGKSFLVVGPGEILDHCLNVNEFDYIVRIAGPGAFDWTSTSDLFEGRAEVVYLNPENLENLKESSSRDPKLLSGVDWVCVKKTVHVSLPTRMRSVDTGGLLFLRGHANLIPLICVDLSRIPGTKIRIVGSTFFASQTAYRPDSVRFGPDGRRAMENGSRGMQYERSTIISSHNPFQNLSIVRNLVNIGRVSGDQKFAEICGISEREYAQRLDSIYGELRR